MAEPPGADAIDNPLERLELLAGDDEAVAQYLGALAVTSPREREMLAELARTTPLADPAAFPAAHRRVAAALESLGRHGHHGSQSGRDSARRATAAASSRSPGSRSTVGAWLVVPAAVALAFAL